MKGVLNIIIFSALILKAIAFSEWWEKSKVNLFLKTGS